MAHKSRTLVKVFLADLYNAAGAGRHVGLEVAARCGIRIRRDLVLTGTLLERCFRLLEVRAVVLRPDDRAEDEEASDDAEKYTLDGRVVRDVHELAVIEDGRAQVVAAGWRGNCQRLWVMYKKGVCLLVSIWAEAEETMLPS